MSLPSSTRWRLADPGLVTRQWPGEDERVVYSLRSGDVHLINAAASALLGAIAEQPLTAEEIAVRLANAAHRPIDGELADAVKATLASLDAAGLIDPLLP